MQATFEHLSGSKKGQLEQINGDRITIGRNPTNALHFDAMVDLDVSGDHAQLAVGDEGKYILTDLGSKNGTFVNGTRVAGSIPVEPGSRLQFGKGGPEVKIAYTPGAKKPGATRVMLAQVQQQMQVERVQAQQSKKTMLIALVVVLVLAIVGGVAFTVVSKLNAAKNTAKDQQAAAVKKRTKAESSKAPAVLAEAFNKAAGLQSDGDDFMKKHQYDKAADAYKQAAEAFDSAGDQAAIKNVAAEAQRVADEKARQAQLAAEQQIAQMQAEQEERARKQAEKEEKERAENQARIEALQRKIAEGDQKAQNDLAALRDKLKPESARAKAIIGSAEPSICYIYGESYVQPKDTTVRNRIASAEGTGFVIAPDTIAVAKHIVQPWKFDGTQLATAKKIKEEIKDESGDIKDYVEVWMKKPGDAGLTKVYDNVAGTCKLGKIMEDKKEDKTQAVTITWNLQPTAVPGIQVHAKNVNDLALIEVPGGALKPLSLAGGALDSQENMLAMGAVKTAGKDTITLTPVVGQVQTITKDIFNVNATGGLAFPGGPVFKYDGYVYGMIVGVEQANLVCLPISLVMGLSGVKPQLVPAAGASTGDSPGGGAGATGGGN